MKSAVAVVATSALIIWIIFLGMIQANLVSTFEQRAHSGQFPFIDFLRFYAAGKVMLSPDRAHAYEVPFQLKYINEMISPAKIDYTSESHYLPFAMPLFALFASAPAATSYALLDIISPAMGLSAMALLLASVRKFNSAQIIAFLLGMMASFPGWRCMFAGNLSWILITIVLLFVWAVLTNRQFLAGVFMAATGFKYNYSPHLFACFLGLRWKKAILGLAVGCLALFVFGALWMGVGSYIAFPQILLHSESHDSFVVPAYMISITGPLSNFMPFHTSGIIAVVTEFLAMAALFFAWSKVKDSDPLVALKRRWLFALTSIIMLTFNIHAHHYEAMFLAIAAGLTLTKLNPLDVFAIKPASFRWWSLLFVFFPLIGWLIMVVAQKYIWAFGFVTLFQLIMLGIGLFIYRRITTFGDTVPDEWRDLLGDDRANSTE